MTDDRLSLQMVTQVGGAARLCRSPASSAAPATLSAALLLLRWRRCGMACSCWTSHTGGRSLAVGFVVMTGAGSVMAAARVQWWLMQRWRECCVVGQARLSGPGQARHASSCGLLLPCMQAHVSCHTITLAADWVMTTGCLTHSSGVCMRCRHIAKLRLCIDRIDE